MGAIRYEGKRDLLRRIVSFRIVSEDPECFEGPVDLSQGNVPAKAAGMAQPLCFRQVGFAPAESSFRFAELAPFLRLPQGALHGRNHSGEPSLKNVVGRA